MHGVRVVDLSRVLAGPWATQQLADQGAEVIKIEPPGGDETRRFGPIIDGESTYFLCANRNKRVIELDLKTSAGIEVLHRLLADADVLVANFRPGVMARLGLDWASLHERYPRLIYVAIHAYGDEGDPEWVQRPGYDLVLQAMGGAASFTGFPGGPPVKMGCSIADMVSALLAVQAVLLALLDRQRTGKGQKVVVNMLQAQANMLAYHATRYTVAGQVEEQRGNSHKGLVPYDIYPCSDGWFAVGCGNDAIWARLVEALDLPNPDHWRRNVDRVTHRDAVDAVVRERMAALTCDEADERFASHGIPGGPVQTVDQVMAHPQVDRIQVNHHHFGAITLPGPTLKTRTTRSEHTPPPPRHAHRGEILKELGYNAQDIDTLKERGAFGDAVR